MQIHADSDEESEEEPEFDNLIDPYSFDHYDKVFKLSAVRCLLGESALYVDHSARACPHIALDSIVRLGNSELYVQAEIGTLYSSA